ncbi:hypothetical protein ACFZAD_29120 [Streptomyces iakyrus]|uniref:hypothetical protein n=1 Tax=Streptomyces iakyrus TaxID=68219 RepID=UPI0036E9CCFB
MVSNVLNPKTAVFFTGLLPTLAPPQLPAARAMTLLVLVWLGVSVFLLSKAGPVLRRPRVRRVLGRTTGLVLIGSGSPWAVPPADVAAVRDRLTRRPYETGDIAGPRAVAGPRQWHGQPDGGAHRGHAADAPGPACPRTATRHDREDDSSCNSTPTPAHPPVPVTPSAADPGTGPDAWPVPPRPSPSPSPSDP